MWRHAQQPRGPHDPCSNPDHHQNRAPSVAEQVSATDLPAPPVQVVPTRSVGCRTAATSTREKASGWRSISGPLHVVILEAGTPRRWTPARRASRRCAESVSRHPDRETGHRGRFDRGACRSPRGPGRTADRNGRSIQPGVPARGRLQPPRAGWPPHPRHLPSKKPLGTAHRSPPFKAYPIVSSIVFTFGDLRRAIAARFRPPAPRNRAGDGQR